MIRIRLAGGLGNQIFQLGAGLLLAKRANIKKVMLNDDSLGRYNVKRKSELLSFFDFTKLDLEIEFQNNKAMKFRTPRIFPLKVKRYPLVSDRNFRTTIQYPNKIFSWLDGYFQHCLTQSEFNEEIDILNNMLIDNPIKKQNGCVVHIRGGDFVKLGWNKITPQEYYLRAMDKLNSEHSINEFCIVTDDVEYAKSILNTSVYNFKFIGGKSLVEDFHLLASYKYKIISSSTFALWATVLFNNCEKVIAPSYWTPNNLRKIKLSNEQRLKGF
jgi:hypothetical protein